MGAPRWCLSHLFSLHLRSACIDRWLHLTICISSDRICCCLICDVEARMRISLTAEPSLAREPTSSTVPHLQTSSDGDTIWTQCRVIRKCGVVEEPYQALG